MARQPEAVQITNIEPRLVWALEDFISQEWNFNGKTDEYHYAVNLLNALNERAGA